ncbi:MAG TPA: hypothetical protein VF824_12435 [Thermoanaerobaculia bacterium]|jgi:hypothetical protein
MRSTPTAAAIATTILLSSTLFAQSPQLISNSIKYKNEGHQAATGRSGSATIAARALLAQDGTTGVEVTTGSFDSAGAGSIDKVQVKLTRGEVSETRNYTGLSGNYASVTLPGAGYNESVQISANVSGIDASRTDVVTVNETVKLRPDLWIPRILAAHAIAGAPSPIVATVLEHNGDSGARADCVLYVDGVEVGRARNIWVDARGAVAVSFRHVFDTTGTKQLRVALENQRPADWATEDNFAESTIEVYDGTTTMPQSAASADETEHTTRFRSQSSTTWIDSYESGWQQSVTFQGWMYGSFNPSSIRASYSESTDGRLVTEMAELATEGFHRSPWRDEACASLWGSGVDGELCISGNRLLADLRRHGGDVTYRASGRGYDDWEGGYYYINWDVRRQDGPQVRYGDTVSMTVRVSDGTTLYESLPQITLEPHEWHYNRPNYCYVDWQLGQICSDYQYDETGKRGYYRSW